VLLHTNWLVELIAGILELTESAERWHRTPPRSWRNRGPLLDNRRAASDGHDSARCARRWRGALRVGRGWGREHQLVRSWKTPRMSRRMAIVWSRSVTSSSMQRAVSRSRRRWRDVRPRTLAQA